MSEERCEACGHREMRLDNFGNAVCSQVKCQCDCSADHLAFKDALLAQRTRERDEVIIVAQIADACVGTMKARAEAAEARLTNEDGETCLQSIGGTCLAPGLMKKLAEAEALAAKNDKEAEWWHDCNVKARNQLAEAVELLREHVENYDLPEEYPLQFDYLKWIHTVEAFLASLPKADAPSKGAVNATERCPCGKEGYHSEMDCLKNQISSFEAEVVRWKIYGSDQQHRAEAAEKRATQLEHDFALQISDTAKAVESLRVLASLEKK